MTTLIEQIEEMRIRMVELATGEQDLVRALGDALSRADQKLLQDVRVVAEEHEARRGAILKELQGLAARMGALPRPRAPFAVLEEQARDVPPREAVQPLLEAATHDADEEVASTVGHGAGAVGRLLRGRQDEQQATVVVVRGKQVGRRSRRQIALRVDFDLLAERPHAPF